MSVRLALIQLQAEPASLVDQSAVKKSDLVCAASAHNNIVIVRASIAQCVPCCPRQKNLPIGLIVKTNRLD